MSNQTLNVYLSTEMAAFIWAYAKKMETSRSQVMRMALREFAASRTAKDIFEKAAA